MLIFWSKQHVQWAEVVPRPANNCRLCRNRTGRELRNSSLGQTVWQGSSKTGSEQHLVLLCSVDQGNVLFAIQQNCTRNSWFCSWERAKPSPMILKLGNSAQEEGVPSSEMHRLLQSHFLGKKAQQIYHGEIPIWSSQDSRQYLASKWFQSVTVLP